MPVRSFDCAVPLERSRGLDAAATALASGSLVVLPTDTVYGVAADAFDATAVTRLLEAKDRAGAPAPPVLVASPAAVDGLALGIDDTVRVLMAGFWPGGLTILCRAQPTLHGSYGGAAGGPGSVALRMPLHPVALELLARSGPLAVSSANVGGRPVPESQADARDQLGDAVEIYLDGGPCLPAPTSTVVDATGERLRLLRQGAVLLADLLEATGEDAWEAGTVGPGAADPVGAGAEPADATGRPVGAAR